MSTRILRLHGMTCAACASAIERALRSCPGVREAMVNLLAESASVKADSSLSDAALIDAVRAVGYDAEPIRAGGNEMALVARSSFREQSRRQRQALVQAVGLALPILVLDHYGHSLQTAHHAGMLGWRMLQAALMVMLIISPAGGPIIVGGLRALLHGGANMDSLICLGVLTAVASSLYGTLTLNDAYIHYHAAAIILALVCVGRYLEARAKHRAGSAIAALAKRAPRTAMIRDAAPAGAIDSDTAPTGTVRQIPLDQVSLGDRIVLTPECVVPTDGELIQGQVMVDESLLTGEPMPVARGVGDAVQAGTLVVQGTADCIATQVGRASALGRIVELVQRAQSTRAPMQTVADRMAAWLTPVVALCAVGALAGWLIIAGSGGIANGLRAAIAVMVVACPCAMGLATPTAVFVASGVAALRGILVRDAATLEALARVRTMLWDKTGTLTAGRPAVKSVVKHNPDVPLDQSLCLAASAERFSSHPLAKAIVNEAYRRGLSIAAPVEFESIVGAGVRAVVRGHRVLVGMPEFLRSEGTAISHPQPDDHGVNKDAIGTSVEVAIDGHHVLSIQIDDHLRPSAAESIARLRHMGITSELITGDADRAARDVAHGVGIERWTARATPAQKLALVRERRTEQGLVAMIGDGTNDAAALAAADVGIAFATGTDVATAAAGISLVGSTPMLAVDAVQLARRTYRIMRQNLFWAVAYNAIMLPLAAMGRLPPAWAAAAMMASSLTVVLNALRIRLSPGRHALETRRG